MSDWDDGFGSSQKDDFGFDDGFADSESGAWGNDGFDDDEFDGTGKRALQRITLEVSPLKIVAAVLGGLLAAFLGGLWFVNENGNLWRPLVTAVYVLILALCVYAAVRIAAVVRGDDPELIAARKHKELPVSLRKKMPLKSVHFGRKAAITIAALCLASGIFEFLYDLGAESTAGPSTSYILVLDTSGSMDNTDPGKEVGKAVQELVAGLVDGFPYAVYTFNSGVSLHTEMHQKTTDDASKSIDLEYNGGTEMDAALKQVMNDFNMAYKAKTWTGGENPKVVLFSDGQPSSTWGVRKALKSFQREGIAVSTVSVQGADITLMQEIADLTGGAHIAISDISTIGSAIENAMHSIGDIHRTLFTFRNGRKLSVLYALMRIVFLALIVMGFWMLLYYASAVGLSEEYNLIFLCKAVTAVIAGLLMEMGLQYLSLSEGMARLFFCLLAALAFLKTLYRETRAQRTNISDPAFDPSQISSSNPREHKKLDKRLK